MTSKQPRRDVTSLLRDSVTGFSTYAPKTYNPLRPLRPLRPLGPLGPAQGSVQSAPGSTAKTQFFPVLLPFCVSLETRAWIIAKLTDPLIAPSITIGWNLLTNHP